MQNRLSKERLFQANSLIEKIINHQPRQTVSSWFELAGLFQNGLPVEQLQLDNKICKTIFPSSHNDSPQDLATWCYIKSLQGDVGYAPAWHALGISFNMKLLTWEKFLEIENRIKFGKNPLFSHKLEITTPNSLAAYCFQNPLHLVLQLKSFIPATWTHASCWNSLGILFICPYEMKLPLITNLFPSVFFKDNYIQTAAYCFASAITVSPRLPLVTPPLSLELGEHAMFWSNLGDIFLRGANTTYLPKKFLNNHGNVTVNHVNFSDHPAVYCFGEAARLMPSEPQYQQKFYGAKQQSSQVQIKNPAVKGFTLIPNQNQFSPPNTNNQAIQHYNPQAPVIMPQSAFSPRDWYKLAMDFHTDAKTWESLTDEIKTLLSACPQQDPSTLAVYCLGHALELDKNFPAVWNELGLCFGNGLTWSQYIASNPYWKTNSLITVGNKNPNELAVWCFIKALGLSPNDSVFMSNLGRHYLWNKTTPIIQDNHMMFSKLPPEKAQVSVAAWWLARSLFTMPKSYTWHALAVAFHEGAAINKLPMEFLVKTDILSCLNDNAPAKYSIIVFCLAKALELDPDNAARKKNYIAVLNKLNKLAELISKDEERIKEIYNEKRKAKDSLTIISNKRPKIDNSIPTQPSSQNNHCLFTPVNQFIQNNKPQRPILVFNKNEVMNVIKILRGKSNAMDNCTHYADALLDYFKTGNVPDGPASDLASTENDFYVDTVITPVKREKGSPYDAITRSRINMDECDFSGVAYDEIPPQTPGGTYDLEKEPIIDVTGFTQDSAHVNEINDCLKHFAKGQEHGVSFGKINLGRCGKYVDEAGHQLVYFATADEVWYLDVQLFDGLTLTDSGCISHDLSHYKFAGKDKLGLDTFGATVFYTPMKPQVVEEMELVRVKEEPKSPRFNG